MDRAERDPNSHTKVSVMLSWLRGDWDQCWAFIVGFGPTAVGHHYFVYRCSLFFERPVRPASAAKGDSKNATMNRTLSSDEQREFWAQLFAVVVRYETRKRAVLEVKPELLEDALETETSQI